MDAFNAICQDAVICGRSDKESLKGTFEKVTKEFAKREEDEMFTQERFDRERLHNCLQSSNSCNPEAVDASEMGMVHLLDQTKMLRKQLQRHREQAPMQKRNKTHLASSPPHDRVPKRARVEPTTRDTSFSSVLQGSSDITTSLGSHASLGNGNKMHSSMTPIRM
jgi:hypothetical protein